MIKTTLHKILAIPMNDGKSLEFENIREASHYFEIAQHYIVDSIDIGDTVATDQGEFFFDVIDEIHTDPDGKTNNGKNYEYIITGNGFEKKFNSIDAIAKWAERSANSIYKRIAKGMEIPNNKDGKLYSCQKVLEKTC